MPGHPADTPLSERTSRVFAAMHRGVREQLAGLTAEILDELQRQIPAYESVPREALVEGVAGDLERAIDAVAGGRRPTEEELAGCEEVGETRARQGVPVEALIQAFQIAADRTLEAAYRHGEAHGGTPEDLLLFSRIGWAWAHEATTRAARAHRRAELEAARRDVRQRDELLRRLLHEAGASPEVRLRLAVFDVSASARYHVTRLRVPGGGAGELAEALRRRRPTGALVGVVDGDVVVVSPEVPDVRADLCAGVAGPAPLLELHGAYADASRALQTAVATGRRGVHRLEDLGVLPAVVQDHRLSALLHRRVVEPLGGAEEQERLCHTLETLLEHELRVPDAAAALFVHENTVRKRLRAVEERTGLRLRRVEDLVAVWWALRARAVSGPTPQDP